MAEETNTSNKAYAIASNGTSSSGAMLTVEDSIGTLSTNASDWNAEKAYQISRAIAGLIGTGSYSGTKRVATFAITPS